MIIGFAMGYNPFNGLEAIEFLFEEKEKNCFIF